MTKTGSIPPFTTLSAITAIVLWCSALSVQAQWKTETFRLKNGWNGIYLHVDAKYADLTNLVGPVAISEIWLWTPTFSTRQFITNPDTPTNTGSNWLYWQSNDPGSATLNRMIGNAAYLIKFDGADDTIWEVKGIPVPPVHKWSSTGENFLGLSTPAGAEPDFESWLAKEPALAAGIEIFGYVGGDLADNPVRVLSLRNIPVTRGQAYWMKASNYNSYYHPFDLSLQRAAGVDFFPGSTQNTVRLRNRTDANLTVTISLVDSDSAPSQTLLDSGDPNTNPDSLPGIEYGTTVVDSPPIVIRGSFDSNTMTFDYSSLTAADIDVVLKPEGETGSEVDVVLGVKLSDLTGNAGDYYAGILRFTDSLGHASIDVPTRVIQQSREGLWIGQARVSKVKNSTTVSGTQTFGNTSTTMPLRLILHHDGSNATKLLQRIYVGFDAEMDPILSTTESLLDPQYLNISRRISAVHLPWTRNNTPWNCTGTFDIGGSIEVQVGTAYDDQRSNPFLHTYHPDHDNKNAFFDTVQPQGEESYALSRDITLNFQAASTDFESVTRDGTHLLSGEYLEEITIEGKGSESKTFEVKGQFSLTHLNQDLPLSTLLENP